MTDSAANAAHEALIAARSSDDPEERQEAREEVRITAMLLIVQELEFLVNALTEVAGRINKVVANIDGVIQSEVRDDDQ